LGTPEDDRQVSTSVHKSTSVQLMSQTSGVMGQQLKSILVNSEKGKKKTPKLVGSLGSALFLTCFE
jgi:hypothetical protein